MTDRVPGASGRVSFQRANDESRERLARLVASLTPSQRAVDLGEGWTVSSALAHMGFWDRWQADRWVAMLSGEWTADSESVLAAEHLANESLHPYWAGVSAADIPGLALEAAAELDRLIASAPDALVDSLEGTPISFLLHRHRHRDEHLDHIERSLAASGYSATGATGPVDRSYLDRNAASRRRLAEVVARLTPADLARSTEPSVEGSWTVGQALGHLAFWDRSLAARWQAALAKGPGCTPDRLPAGVADPINAALEPFTAAFAEGSPDAFLAEVVAAADALDALIAGLPPEAPIAWLGVDQPRALDRSGHRADHLDTVERCLAHDS